MVVIRCVIRQPKASGGCAIGTVEDLPSKPPRVRAGLLVAWATRLAPAARMGAALAPALSRRSSPGKARAPCSHARLQPST